MMTDGGQDFTSHAIRQRTNQPEGVPFHKDTIRRPLRGKKQVSTQPRRLVGRIMQHHHLVGIATKSLALYMHSFPFASCRDTAFIQTDFAKERRFRHRCTEIEHQIAYWLITTKLIGHRFWALLTIKTFVSFLINYACIQSTRPKRDFIQCITVTSASVKN